MLPSIGPGSRRFARGKSQLRDRRDRICLRHRLPHAPTGHADVPAGNQRTRNCRSYRGRGPAIRSRSIISLDRHTERTNPPQPRLFGYVAKRSVDAGRRRSRNHHELLQRLYPDFSRKRVLHSQTKGDLRHCSGRQPEGLRVGPSGRLLLPDAQRSGKGHRRGASVRWV